MARTWPPTRTRLPSLDVQSLMDQAEGLGASFMDLHAQSLHAQSLRLRPGHVHVHVQSPHVLGPRHRRLGGATWWRRGWAGGKQAFLDDAKWLFCIAVADWRGLTAGPDCGA